MSHISPGLKEQAHEEFKATGTFSDSTLHQVADIVKANHPRAAAAPGAATFDWLALVKQILTILLSLIPAAKPTQPE